MIVPWNSPLKPIFLSAVIQLRERGTLDYLQKVWEGKDIVSSKGAELYSLSIGQVVLAILIFLSYFGLALVILGIEMIYQKLDTPKNQKSKPTGAHLDPQMALLNFEYTRKQYKIIEDYFEGSTIQLEEDFLKALKYVKQLEELRQESGDHDSKPWTYHEMIKTIKHDGLEQSPPKDNESKVLSNQKVETIDMIDLEKD